MNALQLRQTQVLEDTIKYYSEDPTRRCIGNINTEDGNVTACVYSGTTINKLTDGCAVGRLLPKELAIKLDKEYTLNDNISSGVGSVWHELPEDIQELNQKFLESLQNLHDAGSYWRIGGLTEDGRRYVEYIKKIIVNEL